MLVVPKIYFLVLDFFPNFVDIFARTSIFDKMVKALSFQPQKTARTGRRGWKGGGWGCGGEGGVRHS